MAHYPTIGKGVPVIYAIRYSFDPTLEYRYVGLTIMGTKRFRDHLSDAANPNSVPYLYPKSRWMRKHNYNVTFDILEYVDEASMLNLCEQKWIHILKSRGHRLLNLTDGGGGAFGFSISKETRERMSKAATGRKASDTTRKRMSEAQFGRKHTEESKEKMRGRQNTLGYRHTQEAKDAIASKHSGRKKSPETRAKMSKAQMGNQNGLGRIVSDETKLKLAEARRGKPNIGSHVRWHTKREIVDPKCLFCMEGATQ